MTIKTRDNQATQVVAAVVELIARTVERLVLRGSHPNDGMLFLVESPERPMEVAESVADLVGNATGSWLSYDLETSRFFLAFEKGGQWWLSEEELTICCYKLLYAAYYLEEGQKQPFNPTIIRVAEVVEALKALRVATHN